MSKELTAVILAGGQGTRLRPFTSVLPKPLVPVNGKPILEIIINKLKKNKFKNIIICLSKKNNLIKAYFGDGYKFGVKINYVYEKKPLSTMGPLKLIKKPPKNFLVMNGDVLAGLSLIDFYNFHIKSEKIFSVAVKSIFHQVDYGILKFKKKKLTEFLEKPKFNYHVSMGIYLVNKELLKLIPSNKFFGFDDLMKKLIKSKQDINIYNSKSSWLDIGRPSDYMKANRKNKYI
ncbi:sugar phosphate nucleotidyltransferase [Candidatus Pelagibacter sp.]|nr:sugar phosphate nucleotidyltransferase [Candidatus Pelagibacter sp.]